jgi:Domain of unknown function (DUF4760)
VQCSELPAVEATPTVIVCVASSFDWVALVGLAVIMVSVVVAWQSLKAAKASAAKRATLDMIEKAESTPYYHELYLNFAYHCRQKSLSSLHDAKEERDRKERQQVVSYLNHYKIVSIGIKEGILDENYYKEWMKGYFISDWNDASDFIQGLRWKWKENLRKWEYHPEIYKNYQTVACKWGNSAIRLDQTRSGPPADKARPYP